MNRSCAMWRTMMTGLPPDTGTSTVHWRPALRRIDDAALFDLNMALTLYDFLWRAPEQGEPSC